MDKFFCSHRCTSTVRLWSGARSVFKHRRVPLPPYSLLAFLPVLLSMPLPQYDVFLYSLILSISPAVQDFRSRPSMISAFGLGMCLLRIQRCNVRLSTPAALAASETV
jgi:hypothetical protein